MDELVKKYYNNMETAFKYQYARAVPLTDMKKLVELYENQTNTKLNNNFNCSVCQLNTLKKMYELWGKKDNTVNTSTDTIDTDNSNNKPKKRGRPKK